MRNFLISIVVNWISILLLDRFLPILLHANNWLSVKDWVSALIVAVVLSLLNVLVRPILKIIAIPLNILTLGLFTFVINMIILYLASVLTANYGFKIQHNWIVLLVVAFILSILNSILYSLLKSD
ncbi:phage holin family protein [bacterium]|nr:phage holin family protein [bacterium]